MHYNLFVKNEKKIEEKLKDEDQWAFKEGVRENSESQREFSNPQVVPTTKNTMEGMHIVKGGNISKYQAKVNALSKLSHLSSTLGFTRNKKLATQVKKRKEHNPWIF